MRCGFVWEEEGMFDEGLMRIGECASWNGEEVDVDVGRK